MKKKIVMMIMAVSMALVFTACGNKDADSNKEKEVEVTEEAAEEVTEETEEVSEETAAIDEQIEEVKEAAGEEAFEVDPNAKKLQFTVPAAFTESDTPGLYMTAEPETDGSNIYYLQAAADTTAMDITEDQFVDQITAMYEQTYGQTVDVTIDEFTKTTVAGEDAIKIVCSYTFMDIPVKQLEYMISTDESLEVVTFTQMADADWFADFEACVETFAFAE